MTRAIRFALLVTLVPFIPAIPAAPATAQYAPEPDALIGGGEEVRDHEGAYEEIDQHEGSSEDIHAHEGATEDIHNHESATEDIHDHEEGSESLAGRSVPSESLTGMENDPQLALSAARQQLLDARQRHQRAVAAEEKRMLTPAPAASPSPTASHSDDDSWTHRLEIAKNRVLVAEANLGIYDQAYADMIRNDSPRGDARQKIIDSREHATERLAAERATLPKLVERARAAGVSQSVLNGYETHD